MLDKKKKFLQEIDVVSFFSVFVLYRLFLFCSSIVLSLIYANQLRKTSTRDKKIEKNLKMLLKEDYKVWVIPSTDMNAFTFGTKEIFLFHGIKQKMNMNEIIAICLHEISHIKKYHPLKTTLADPIFAILYATIEVALDLIFPNLLYFFVVAYFIVFKISKAQLSQKFEWDSDDFAIKMGYGNYLASAFMKIQKQYKIPEKMTFYEKMIEFFQSHPHITKRIKHALKKKEVLKDIVTSKSIYSATIVLLHHSGLTLIYDKYMKDNSFKNKIMSLAEKIQQKLNLKIRGF